MVASQKAPLYLALTSVPMFKNGGSSEDCEGVRGVSSGGGVGGEGWIMNIGTILQNKQYLDIALYSRKHTHTLSHHTHTHIYTRE